MDESFPQKNQKENTSANGSKITGTAAGIVTPRAGDQWSLTSIKGKFNVLGYFCTVWQLQCG